MATRRRKQPASRNRVMGKQSSDETEGRAGARHEALPQTSPGGKPPETPAPFPWELIMGNGGKPSRVRKPRPKSGRALDCFPPFPGTPAEIRERGLVESAASCLPLVGTGPYEKLEASKERR